MAQLKGKIIIEGKIITLSGLHIGGQESVMEIGAVENSIIKTSDGIAYIPGSSLKGKLRNMLARAANSHDVSTDIELGNNVQSDIKYIARLFGAPEHKSRNTGAEALLKIQDCLPITPIDKLEIKMENSINRLTGEANPRPLERVPQGNSFSLKMIMDVYDEILTKSYLDELQLAMILLEYDHLGGCGSRGCGSIKFQIDKFKYLKIDKLSINEDYTSFKEELEQFQSTINQFKS